MKFDVDAITIEDCTEDKFWTPSNPFLYEIEVITNGDTYSDRFVCALSTLIRIQNFPC